MSFVELRFLLFFPTVVALFLVLPTRVRWMLLLVASYVFYMAFKPEYGALLFAITLIDYCAGLAMEHEKRDTYRTAYLLLSLSANLGILFVFKYFNFFFQSLEQLLHFIGHPATFPFLSIVLPIGISFHIFQSLSYTIEVYRRRYEPVTHFGKFALYVSFFPQLAAGPIERPQGLLTQIVEGRAFNLEKAQSGIRLMLWGFFKKIVIADTLAPFVNAVYGNPGNYPGPTYIFATVLFAYEIYCDFSGYTDIARGAARVFGYDLMLNFNRPFHATSLTDFWNRWHISLTSWLRDYLYQPLVFTTKRITPFRIYSSLFITLVLIGLWHGANWTYVIFGALHGIYLVVGGLTGRLRSKLHTPLFIKRRIVFLLVCFSYIFFRASTVHDAFSIVGGLGSGWQFFFSSMLSSSGRFHVLAMDIGWKGLLTGLLGVCILESVEALNERVPFGLRLAQKPVAIRAVLYATVISVILLFGALGSTQQFIYFQF